MTTASLSQSISSFRKPKLSRRVKSNAVRFSEHSTLIVTCRKSPDELKALWYSKQQIKCFKQLDVKASRNDVLSSNLSLPKGYIKASLATDKILPQRFDELERIVGIEHLLSGTICKTLCKAKSKCTQDVIQECKRQKLLGINDIGVLAAISMKASKFPRLWRQKIGVMNSRY